MWHVLLSTRAQHLAGGQLVGICTPLRALMYIPSSAATLPPPPPSTRKRHARAAQRTRVGCDV